MRVLHVVLRLNPGGAERLVLDLVRQTRDTIESEVCCLDELGEWGEELKAEGTPIHVLDRQPGFQLGLAKKLARLAKGFDVLHCHQYTPWVYGTLSRLFHRGPHVILTEHGRLDDAPPSTKRKIATRVLGMFRSRVISVCEDLCGYMTEAGFRNISVIPNGIRIDPPVPDQSRPQFTVGTIARLDPVKRIDDLIRGVAACSSPMRLMIVGDGPERAKLEAVAEETGVPALFLGYQADARNQLPGFDVFVNCSEQEGISLTLLEAMAASRAIVATAVGGTREVVEHEKHALLIEPHQPAQITAALERLAGDAQFRAELGARARMRVESEYSLKTMIGRYRKLYDECVASAD